VRARRDVCLLEIRSCLRRGDTMGALVKGMMADVMDDCLDLAKIELDQAEWTMSQSEDRLAKALREEREFSRRQGGR
jgi:Ribonuclease G/E